jgi:hypothetical protein
MICYSKKKKIHQPAAVANVCNLSYSGSRDQEYQGSKPVHLEKYPTQKRAGRGLKRYSACLANEALSSSASTTIKKKKKSPIEANEL